MIPAFIRHGLRTGLPALACLALLALLAGAAQAAEKRVALVIGNSAYPGAPLSNPVNDAHDMAAALKKLGFDVIEKTNATQKDMNLAIAQFGEKLRADTVALFFYAGHGMQVKGKNYLIPVDANITSEATVRAMTVDVDTVMDQLAVSPMNIVILDACRNNPFERRFRSVGGGLAQMDAPKGSLIAYATAPGKVASDGSGRNGLYTQELLKNIQTPGLPLEAVFKRVRNGVMLASGEAQTPWEASSLTGDFYFIFTGPATVNVQSAPAADPEAEAWNAAQSADTATAYQGYLDAFPKGRFAPAAKIKLEALKKPGAPAAIAKPPVAEVPAPVSTGKPEDAETAFWNEVKTSGAREYYEAYLKQYAKGKYAALAKLELKKLDDQEKKRQAQEAAERKAAQARLEAEKQAAAERERQAAQQTEQDAWQRAKEGDSAASYAAYLGSYPKGRYATLAEAARQKLLRETTEREKREAAQRQKDAEQQRLTEEQAKREAEKAAAEIRPGKTFKDCSDCPEMVVIPAGNFEMGSNDGDAIERPVHRVTISLPFAIGKTEVTQGQWRAFMSNNPSNFSQCGEDCPVEQVSWNDAQEFVRRLARKTGKNYHLPSESQWEYAARGGILVTQGSSNYSGTTISELGWHSGNSLGKTHKVGTKLPNAFGIYDMQGNVLEWVEDCWNPNYSGAPNDGSPWLIGNCSQRVMRGGSWYNASGFLRTAFRTSAPVGQQFSYFGFRVVRTN